MFEVTGLSESEVIARRERGQGNTLRFQTGRTYLQILRKNAFTFINTVLFAISVVLVLMGRVDDAVVTAGLVLLNVVVGVVQEGRAKRKLEHIALLTRPKASVIRDGHEREIDPSEVVLGDVLIARPGDQIIVDGQVVAGGDMQLDESLLTGESERVRKRPGDTVLSGSFCVSGTAAYEAEQVGDDSFVNQLTAGARAFRQIKTPLQRDVDNIIRILVLVVAPLGVLLGFSHAMRAIPLVESVRAAAVVVALIPQGLFFMTTVAYAMGIVRVAGKGALIQEANAVESISNVDLLCFDKTGTLTTNRIKLHAMRPVDGTAVEGETELRDILGDYAASTPSPNRTTLAIKEAFEGQARPIVEEVPFSSEHRWSALAFDDASLRGTYVLGAPEVLRSHLQFDPGLDSQIADWTSQGLRALLFAYRPVNAPLYDDQGEPVLSSDL
ncbi:MAG: HAD-IC family P-type ATPase, partial [Anaerolineae bacterium]|nr:HAD-IC family P-type ATPase [Anaerolineae bacterium]